MASACRETETRDAWFLRSDGVPESVVAAALAADLPAAAEFAEAGDALGGK